MTTAAWTGWAKIEVLIRAAGTALSAPIADVRRGLPFSVTAPMIRYWYDGLGDNPNGPNTLDKKQEGVKLTVGVFLPMKGAGSPTSDAALDSLLEEADRAIQAALMGDAFLGTLGTDNSAMILTIGDSSASVEVIGGAAVRVLVMPLTYGVADTATIAP